MGVGGDLGTRCMSSSIREGFFFRWGWSHWVGGPPLGNERSALLCLLLLSYCMVECQSLRAEEICIASLIIKFHLLASVCKQIETMFPDLWLRSLSIALK